MTTALICALGLLWLMFGVGVAMAEEDERLRKHGTSFGPVGIILISTVLWPVCIGAAVHGILIAADRKANA